MSETEMFPVKMPDLTGFTPGSYVLINGETYLVADADFAFGGARPFRKAAVQTGPDELRIVLQRAPWAKGRV